MPPIWDREKPCGSLLPHHRTNASPIRRFGRLSQTWKSALADSQFQPERALSSNQPRFHPSHQARARWTRRMPYRGSRTSHCPSLSIPLQGNRSGLRCSTLRLDLSVAPPFGLECLTSLACLTPTMPSADFSTVFSADYSTPSFDPLKHRRGFPG